MTVQKVIKYYILFESSIFKLFNDGLNIIVAITVRKLFVFKGVFTFCFKLTTCI